MDYLIFFPSFSSLKCAHLQTCFAPASHFKVNLMVCPHLWCEGWALPWWKPIAVQAIE